MLVCVSITGLGRQVAEVEVVWMLVHVLAVSHLIRLAADLQLTTEELN